MSDEHDSWFKDAFGVDLGQSLNKIKDEASAVIDDAKNKVTQVVQGVQGAVEGAIDGVTSAAAGVVKKAAGAVAPSGSSGAGPAGATGGGTGSFPLGGSVGRGGKNAANDVRAVQAALGISADGQCGGGTIGAIEAFQRTMGLAKPDGRVDAGGGTERALAGGAGGASAAAPASVPAKEDDDSGSLFDRAVQGVKDLGGQIVEEAEEDLDAAKAFGGKVVEGAKKTLGNPNAENGDKPTVPQADGGFGFPKTLKDAVAGFAPVIDIPGLGRFDMAANLTKAANDVVAQNTPRKLPFLEDAVELLAQASLILDENRTSEVGAIPLPRPTVAFSGQCCSTDELQKFRGAIEAPRNGLQSAVNAYNDTQRAIEDAAEQGKKICYGGLATCLLGSAVARGGAGAAACLAGAIACIAAASPVQNAIRTQIKAKEDVEIANGALGRALANHRNCFVNLCPAPAAPSLKKPPEPVDLGDIDDPPVDEFNP